jgi:TonB family protein
MKLNALLAALALACLASPVLADAYIDGWMAQARARVDAKIQQAGLKQGAQTLDVRLHVDGNGDLGSPRIVTSSGSTAIDAAVLKAVRHVSAPLPPAEMSGRSLLFHLSVEPTQTASLPAPQRR